MSSWLPRTKWALRSVEQQIEHPARVGPAVDVVADEQQAPDGSGALDRASSVSSGRSMPWMSPMIQRIEDVLS